MSGSPGDGHDWTWVLLGPEPAEGARVTGALRTPGGEPAVHLSVVRGRRRPSADALRIDPGVVAEDGPAWAVSLVVPAVGARPLFDDPAVIGATRAAMAEAGAVAFTSSLVADPTRWAGAISGVAPATAAGWPGWYDRDPFRRIAPGRSLLLDAGVLRAAPLAGPGTQRYAGAPWPHRGFPG